MHSFSRKAARTGRLVVPMLVAGGVLIACSDQPVAPRAALEPADGLQAFDCQAVVSGTPSVRCTPAVPGAGQALGTIIGGQDILVTLTSTNLVYDAGTDVFSFDVTVQNRMSEAMGTPDGVTPAVDGIKVFFLEEPVGTGGSVSVIEEDGNEFFTNANQPFYRYTDVLQTNEVSQAHPWKFNVPAGVSSFKFRVLVSTEVQYKLVINEVLVNPAGNTRETDGDWVEIFNAGTLPVDLENLVIADSAASGRRPFHRIASSVIVPSGGYVVLGTNTNTTTNGGVPVDYAWGGSVALASSLDAFKVARVVGSDTLTLDRTQYSSASTSAIDGVSRELKNPALDNSNMDGSNWGSASVTSVYGEGGRGTPKAQNSVYTP